MMCSHHFLKVKLYIYTCTRIVELSPSLPPSLLTLSLSLTCTPALPDLGPVLQHSEWEDCASAWETAGTHRAAPHRSVGRSITQQCTRSLMKYPCSCLPTGNNLVALPVEMSRPFEILSEEGFVNVQNQMKVLIFPNSLFWCGSIISIIHVGTFIVYNYACTLYIHVVHTCTCI